MVNKKATKIPLTPQAADRDNKTIKESIKEPPYQGLSSKYIPRGGG